MPAVNCVVLLPTYAEITGVPANTVGAPVVVTVQNLKSNVDSSRKSPR